ncbi:allantoate amidohydrolase [Actinomadura madurae]|uniref:allantoate amidohydrolase n=1 Tax=Actinomadura madurae TaxID=1993 RepID=UPI0020261825|nr:allantoate amidohydrolase [Actinomadura madurae]URM96451.1 allantoate amidohydrolase [Actinomadura madurae]
MSARASGGDFLDSLARGGVRVFQTDRTRRAELIADVVAAAWGTHGQFIDADRFLTKPTVLRRMVSLLADMVPPDVDRLIGRETHSLALGTALALETGLPLVIARRAESSGGRELRCHGELHPGERVLVVEGVTGTGASAERAVRAVRKHGATVVGVLAAVDRDAGAAERLAHVGTTLDRLLDDAELRAAATRGQSHRRHRPGRRRLRRGTHVMTRLVPVKADADRLLSTVQAMAALSEEGPGVTRLAYSRLERRAHELFAEWMEDAGCVVRTDPAGNTIASRPGRNEGPAVGTGSHLDSVYAGGRFDGIAGTVAAVEVARMLRQAGVETELPLRFVAFAGEEGARFGQACCGSKLAAGLSTRAELDERRDRDGVSLAEAMTAVGLDPDLAVSAPWRPADWSAFVELHVEQGSVLETAGVDVGVVDLISGSTRLELVLSGRASHTGGTPMRGRADALAAAAEAVLAAERLALDARYRGTRATVGRLVVEPGSITTIPGMVTFSLDVRDVDADRQRRAVAEIVGRMRAICLRRGVGLSARPLADTSAVVLPDWVRAEITGTADEIGVRYRVLTSGASHDAQMINRVTPTAMIFVPSRAGLSHVPEEWTDPAELAVGATLLFASMRRLDARAALAMRAAGSPSDQHEPVGGPL